MMLKHGKATVSDPDLAVAMQSENFPGENRKIDPERLAQTKQLK